MAVSQGQIWQGTLPELRIILKPERADYVAKFVDRAENDAAKIILSRDQFSARVILSPLSWD
jgi:hypothetical protein